MLLCRGLRAVRQQTLRFGAPFVRRISEGSAVSSAPIESPAAIYDKLMRKNTRKHNIKTLRRVFGYDPTEPPFTPTLPGSSLTDALLVSLDIDTVKYTNYLNITPELHFQIGISVLDTRLLHELIAGAFTTHSSRNVIQSFQFHVGDSEYTRRGIARFSLGPSKAIELSNLGDEINTLASGRAVVFVIHGLDSDLRVLSHLNIDLSQQSSGVIDTVEVAQALSVRARMEDLQPELGLRKLPSNAPAGLDARTTLKALLALAVRDHRLLDGRTDRASYVFKTLAVQSDRQARRANSAGRLSGVVAPDSSALSSGELRAAMDRLQKEQKRFLDSFEEIQSILGSIELFLESRGVQEVCSQHSGTFRAAQPATEAAQPRSSTPPHKPEADHSTQTPEASSHQTPDITDKDCRIGLDTQPAKPVRESRYKVPVTLAQHLSEWSLAEIERSERLLCCLTRAPPCDEEIFLEGKNVINRLRDFEQYLWKPRHRDLKNRNVANIYRYRHSELAEELGTWQTKVSECTRKDDLGLGGKDRSGSVAIEIATTGL